MATKPRSHHKPKPPKSPPTSAIENSPPHELSGTLPSLTEIASSLSNAAPPPLPPEVTAQMSGKEIPTLLPMPAELSQSEPSTSDTPQKRGPGRPKGSPNRKSDAGTASDGVAELPIPKPPKSLNRKGPPAPDEWQRWLEYALTLLTAFYTDSIVKGIDDWTPDEQDTLDEMNSDFTKEFSEPLSRALARNPLNKRYGRPIVDSYDWLAMLIAVWAYHRDLGELRSRRKEAQAAKRQGDQMLRIHHHQEGPPNAQLDEAAAPSARGPIAIPPGAAI